MSNVSKVEAETIDEEIKKRKALIGALPKDIGDQVQNLGLLPGEIEIKIAQRNGLFIDIKRNS